LNAPTTTTDSLYNSVAGGFFATIAYLVGGFDNLMITFSMFVALDFFTGALAGFYSSKLSSE